MVRRWRLFFVEGVSNPFENAQKWAIANSWNNVLKEYKYKEYAVLSAVINVCNERFLDLTTKEGIQTFNYFRDMFIRKIAEAKMRCKGGFKDGHIINEARNSIRIDVVKGDFYIKFETERYYGISFRIPNTTITAVYEIDCINKESIKIEIQKAI